MQIDDQFDSIFAPKLSTAGLEERLKIAHAWLKWRQWFDGNVICIAYYASDFAQSTRRFKFRDTAAQLKSNTIRGVLLRRILQVHNRPDLFLCLCFHLGDSEWEQVLESAADESIQGPIAEKIAEAMVASYPPDMITMPQKLKDSMAK